MFVQQSAPSIAGGKFKCPAGSAGAGSLAIAARSKKRNIALGKRGSGAEPHPDSALIIGRLFGLVAISMCQRSDYLRRQLHGFNPGLTTISLKERSKVS